MIDLNNPVFVCPFSPQAEWKHALLIRLGQLFNLPTLVETGTCYGGTVEAVRNSFKDVWSIELSPVFYEASSKKFAGIPNVHLFFGSSGEMLPSVIERTTGPLLFWLDAHLTGGPEAPSANNGDQTNAELDAVVRLRPDSLVVIDDVQMGADGTFYGPDAPIVVPSGWQTRYLSGELALHAGGYNIPERF
jgi:hypothetical protein